MPTWKQDHTNLSLEANPTQNLFLNREHQDNINALVLRVAFYNKKEFGKEQDSNKLESKHKWIPAQVPAQKTYKP